MRLGAVAVLEDLDADDQRVARLSGQRGEVTADQAVTAAGGASGELGDRSGGDVQAREVQPADHQRQVVAAVAAADVKAAGHASPAGGAEDVMGEGHRWFVLVAAGQVFGVPGGSRAAGGGPVGSSA